MIDKYLAAIIQYYTSANRPYSREDFPGIDVAGLSIERVLSQGGRTQVVGPPGSGKTTFLDWVALRAAQLRQALPIFVSLRRYTSNLNDLIRVSVERFSSDVDLTRMFDAKRGVPGPAFLLDAINEVPSSFLPKVEADILELTNSFPTAPMVITSRAQLVGRTWQGWSTVAIPELTDQQIDAYLQGVPRGNILRKTLLESPQLRDLSRRPYFLHTIRNAWVHGADFRSYLMREIPRYTAWRGHTKSHLPTIVSPQVVDNLLSGIALDLAIRGLHSLTVDRLVELATPVTPEGTPVSVLADAVQATDVLHVYGDYLSFQHKSLLEAYAARALATRLDEPGVLEPLLASVLKGPFGVGIANNFVSVISNEDISHLKEHVSGNVLFELVSKARDVLADRAIVPLGVEEKGPQELAHVAATVARFSDRQESVRKDILVIAVHGFNTRGDWKNELGLVLTRATDGERFLYRAWDYGKFRFGILNPFSRRRQVKKFQDFFNNLVRSFKEVPEIAIVAHSFGAYIFAHAVRRFPEVEVNRVLFLGAALPRAFDWSHSIEQCGRVLNITGGADVALAFARFVPGLGTAGRDGFLTSNKRLIQVTEAYSDHGDLFGIEYMRSVWLPFLRDGIIPRWKRGKEVT